MRNLIRALLGKPVQLSPQQEEKLARKQARAAEIIAEREAAGRKAMEDYAAFQAANGGPPPPPAPTQMPNIKEALKQSFENLQDGVGEMFDDRRDVLDVDPDANLNKPPPEVEDPARRGSIAGGEGAAGGGGRA